MAEKNKTTQENPMRDIKISKVVLNIGMGNNIQDIDKAYTLAERLTGKKPIKTVATRKAKTFKVSKGRILGVKVTLRGADKIEFLKKVLIAKENRIKQSNFDDEGNFSFGMKEYLDIPGEKYDSAIGILGFNINVKLERAGYRIKRRKIQKQRIPKKHRIGKEEAKNFIKDTLGIQIL
ncbi:MAG: 50S ribosomal protein L5 [DPANN group archaeon]|nr:50S ribosomal protein L5 [DPANN group archaeon]